MDRINEATQLIGTMIMEVSKDVFVADPSGQELSRECASAERRQSSDTQAGRADMLLVLRCCRRIPRSSLKPAASDALHVTAAEEEKKKEREAVRKAVQARIHTLDESFLVTLGGFVRAATQDGDAAMHGMPCSQNSERCAPSTRAGIPRAACRIRSMHRNGMPNLLISAPDQPCVPFS